MKFLKDAFSEMEHVVWPTAKESRNYMYYTIGAIIIVATLLAILGYFMRTGLVSVRGQFDHSLPVTSTASGEDFVTEAELQKLQEELQRNQTEIVNTGELSLPVTPFGSPIKLTHTF